MPSLSPSPTQISEVSSRAAMVIPDTGLDEEPISPTMREETVTKKKLKSTIRTAPSRFTGTPGQSQRATASSGASVKTKRMDRSRCVRAVAPPPPPMPPRPSLKLSIMVGSDLRRVAMPPNATAPAPT